MMSPTIRAIKKRGG